jgi:hypothetical protein
VQIVAHTKKAHAFMLAIHPLIAKLINVTKQWVSCEHIGCVNVANQVHMNVIHQGFAMGHIVMWVWHSMILDLVCMIDNLPY